ncbi:uncharacterized protein LAESUDRAFT_727967 [Laetiporus sulphureus 93-53]|uniref:Pentacotripeptide-repeat region of PRORP domain-containing protein n=1 Tax=Laetiporus sulphureus 93-53 TaxID=1314785 RepID=A0A165DBJ6_9APHY|nr:uncharacterized protein LAESUDRAFT_727967 [Laetiporus sulphureus 93-53]KZT04488.1 hypothetical protein LAESUDRAFT_727967 [Laetiporus sulphureus 93-53]
MATWLLRTPWLCLSRPRFRWDCLALSTGSNTWSSNLLSKHYFSTPSLSEESPAMLEMKRTSYPNTPLDTSLFEDTTADYCTELSECEQGADSVWLPANASDLLSALVREARFDDANRVLAELKEMGQYVQPSSLYLKFALHALQQEYKDPRDRLTAFTKWWDLIPDASSHDSVSSSIFKVQDALLHDSIPDLPVLTQFAISSAQKGYATAISSQLVSLLIAYASPAISSVFMSTLHDSAAKALQKAIASVPADIADRVEIEHAAVMEDWYSNAVISHCIAARTDHAVQLLQTARKRQVSITPRAYNTASRKLKEMLDTRNLSIVESLRATAEKPLHEIRTRQARFNPHYAPPTELPTSIPEGATVDLAAALRIIRKSLRPSRYPSPAALAIFMTVYKATGRTLALRILRTRSYRTFPTTSMWALAEMLYHLRRDENLLLINVFTHHFHFVAVPRRMWKYPRRAASRMKKDGNVPRESLPLLPSQPLQQKLWPSTHHTALVWRAVAEIMSTPIALEGLYRELLEQVDTAQRAAALPSQRTTDDIESDPQRPADAPLGTGESQDIPSSEQAYPSPIAPSSMYDSAHFNVFIQAFGARFGPSRAAQVISDMYRLGIKPGIESLTTLAAVFARFGDLWKLTSLLDRMEAGEGSARSSQTLPQPNIVTYTAIISWLLKTGRYRDASVIALRMKARLDYQPGMNPLTDAALANLDLALQFSSLKQDDPRDNVVLPQLQVLSA